MPSHTPFIAGNILHSMRENYAQGVDVYYKKVSTSYRNPHYATVRILLMECLSILWSKDEGLRRGAEIVDMACGSGEATEVILEWDTLARALANGQPCSLNRRRTIVCSIDPTTRKPHIVSTDPFTGPAFETRLGYPCLPLSFQDIADEKLPPAPSKEDGAYDLVVCSFALHLLTDDSSLWATLYTLSTQARWLLVLAPHKKPTIKPNWGWTSWNIKSWEPVDYGKENDYVVDRVHARLYKSTQFY
ncbi:fungal protein [Schizosaccharomyces japonicus yFS275]|uniref:Fungal protein n=1 Tax=Schizosaccharomyces japonicus (strain yFS275 / FY16936) TaxID=402676 RepID=B6K0C6_SCHJY|nr:fungal protein [Schizosaccharomyces japonicus yFS275]EEB06276.1 fungal protein [Schizosaccharomyces japonicus yFS275]